VKLGEGLDSQWSEWIMAHRLMDEAQALIKAPGFVTEPRKNDADGVKP